MRERTATRLAWLFFAITVAAFVGALTLALINRSTGGGTAAQRDASGIGSILFYSSMLSFSVVGILISSRQSRNKIAWIFLAIGGAWELWWLGASYLVYGVITHPGSFPAPALVGALTTWLWAPAIGLMGTFLILLFPDGRLLSRGWRPLAWLSAVALFLVSLTDLFQLHSLSNMGFPRIENPLSIGVLEPVFKVIAFSLILLPIGMIGSAVSLVQRFRRSRGIERLQLKWLAAAGAAVAASYILFWLVTIPFGSDSAAPVWAQAVQFLALLSFLLIPMAAGMAILRHRLFDIDIVINKTLVFGVLAAFITAVYVGIVVGVGALVGSGDKPNLALSIAATALVAVAFQPMRERVQGFANRLIYGHRLTAYEVLTRFSRSLGALVSVEDVLPQIARQAAEGLGAEVAVVTAHLENGEEVVSYPGPETTARETGETIAVAYQNEVIGEIAVVKAGEEPLSGQERRLLEVLATQAGVVLHNYRLAKELRVRLQELSDQDEALRDSRERLVSAADTSRRSIERSIREGVEKRLLGIAADLGAVETALDKDPESAASVLDGLAERTNETLEALRDLARGIYPPLLVDKGLIVALGAHIRKTNADVSLEIDGDLAEARFERSVETSCYFCLREALDNVARHAGGAHARITVRRGHDRLVFSVHDDGPGFDATQFRSQRGLQSMRDRIEASGGELSIESSAGAGTTVRGWIPLEISGYSEQRTQAEPVAAAQASSS